MRAFRLGFLSAALPGIAVALGGLLWAFPATAGVATITDVRLWSGPEGTRLVVELSGPVEFDVFTLDDPNRVVVDIADARLTTARGLPDGQGPVRKVRSGPQPGNGLRLVLDLDSAQTAKSFMVGPDATAGHRLVVELPGAPATLLPVAAISSPAAVAASGGKTGGTIPATATATTTATETTAATSTTAATATTAAPMGSVDPVPGAATAAIAEPKGTHTRVASATTVTAVAPGNPVKTLAALTKSRDLVIAIDAGHGGQDPGAMGRGGTREKDVTLAIARRLAAAINAEVGMRAVLIRDGDYFITLGARTRKARQLGADMFVSVHADSVLKREVSGSSVYVLSMRGASDEAARWLAESENAADLKGGVSLDGKDDVLASVLLDVTQKESFSDSVEAAGSVLAALRGVGTVHRPRVQYAGFVVLKSPDIPSMLVETAFISNATDERRLRDTGYQQRIAEAIRAGVRNYWQDNPLPGTRLAAVVAARRDAGGAVPNRTLAER